MMQARWITVEGIEGVGKTYLTGLLASRLGTGCTLLSEVTDAASGSLTSQVITALSRRGDLWLRTGHPVTETLALIALKVAEYEGIRARGGDSEIIIEDRGIDSVAVYQALILVGPGAPQAEVGRAADLIYATASRWRPLPDLTVLLTDKTAACVARLEQRTGLAVSDDDRALIQRAADLYAWQAAREPTRFRVVTRDGRDEEQTIAELADACTGTCGGRP